KRFLLIDRFQHNNRGLKSCELSVRIEDVELAGVLPKCCGRISRGIVVVIRIYQLFKHGKQRFLIIGEILQDLHASGGKTHDCDKVRRLHLRADEFVCGGKRAQLVRRRDVHQIEEQDKQPAVPIPAVPRRRWSDLRWYLRLNQFGCRLLSAWRRSGSRRIFQSLELEYTDRLRHSVFSDGEVFVDQSFEVLSVSIFHDDSFHHQLCVYPDGEGLLLLGGGAG